MDFRGFGARVRKRRKALHMTQDELAEHAGISLSFLGHIERGTRRASLDTLVAIANALSLSTDVLLQDSLTDQVLLTRPGVDQDLKVLREIYKLLDDRTPGWPG